MITNICSTAAMWFTSKNHEKYTLLLEVTEKNFLNVRLELISYNNWGSYIAFLMPLSRRTLGANFKFFVFLLFSNFQMLYRKTLDAKFQVVRFCKIAKPNKETNLAPSRTLTEVFEAIFKKWKIVEFEMVAPNMTDKRHNHFNTNDVLVFFSDLVLAEPNGSRHYT